MDHSCSGRDRGRAVVPNRPGKQVAEVEPVKERFYSILIIFGDSPMPVERTGFDKSCHNVHITYHILIARVGYRLSKGGRASFQRSDSKPFKERSRRLAPADIDEVWRHLQEHHGAGIIKESRSPYVSPKVIAAKRMGTLECV